ncbi:MAG: S8 family serine peptidase [bacterium]
MHGKERFLSIVLLVFSPACCVYAATAEYEPVRLNGIEIDVAALSKTRPFSAQINLSPDVTEDFRHALVQFKEPQSPKDREEIKETGIRFIYYVPQNAYIIAGPVKALDALQKNESVVGVIPIPDRAKIDASIRQELGIESGEPGATVRAREPKALETVKILFHPETSFKEVQRVLLAHNAVLAATQTGFDFRQTVNSITIPSQQLESLAGEEITYLITKIDPPPIPMNLNAQDTSNVDEIHPRGETGYNLTGAGVTVGIWDVGPVRLTHEQLIGRATQEDSYYQAPYHVHATHVAGTIVGSGAGIYSATGMAPRANLLCFDSGRDLAEAEENAYRISVSNHSYASGIGPEQSEVAVTSDLYDSHGNYYSGAQAWDQIVMDHDLTVVRAAGNERRWLTPPYGPPPWANPAAETSKNILVDNEMRLWGYDTMLNVAVAKNVISVGAIEDLVDESPVPDDASMTDFSSWGPTDDGRIKPDVVANGRKLWSCYADSDEAYGPYSGTSMAAPTVTGIIACLVQQFRRRFAGADPSPATMKGILIHTARDGGSQLGPDYRFGWGLVDARAAADFIFHSGLDGDQIGLNLYSGSVIEYPMEYVGEGPIKVTLVWTDPPGIPISVWDADETPNLVNDLDLHVFGPDEAHFPWTLDPSNPAVPARQNTENHRDNVEQIYVESPVEGSYAIWVGGQVNLGDYQEFTLCISGLRFGGDGLHIIHAIIIDPSEGDILTDETPIHVYVIDNLGASKLTFEADGAIIDDATTEGVEGEVIFDEPESETTRVVRWDTSTVPNGRHTIGVTVTSSDGEIRTKNMNVFVLNETEFAPLTLDASPEVSRIWPAGDVDWFTFQTPESATYTIETHRAWDFNAVDTIITLYGPDSRETPIALNDDGGVAVLSKVTQVLEGNRIYYVKVTGYSGSTGPFGISLRTATEEPTLSIVPIVVNGPMVSSETATGDKDQWYTFSTTVFGTHRIRIAPIPGQPEGNPQILLYTAKGEKILTSSLRPGSSVTKVLPGNQTYLMNAVLTKITSGAYSIGVETESSGGPVPITLGAPEKTGRFSSATQGEDWYLLAPTSLDAYVVFEVNSVTEQFSSGPRITIYGPDNPEDEIADGLPRDYPPLATKVFSTLDSKSHYYVKVTPEGWSGSYTIQAREVQVDQFNVLFTITRSFSPEKYRPGEPVTVTLAITSAADVGVRPVNVMEYVPSGWTASRISDPGDFFSFTKSVIRWIEVPEKATELSYELVPSKNAKGPYAVYGQFSYRIGNKTFGFTIDRQRILNEWVDTAVENWSLR